MVRGSGSFKILRALEKIPMRDYAREGIYYKNALRVFRRGDGRMVDLHTIEWMSHKPEEFHMITEEVHEIVKIVR